LDLTQAGKIPSGAERPVRAERQQIVSFEGREGDEERFSFWLTFPNDPDDPETPPTQKQYDTVVAFYGEGPATHAQAGYLISAWFYADEIRSERNFKFSAPRRRLIHVATSAYILSHPELRRKVRAWSEFRWREPEKAVSIGRTTPYRPALQFAHDLIADMRSAGAEIFG
jgi:hypothetical protein